MMIALKVCSDLGGLNFLVCVGGCACVWVDVHVCGWVGHSGFEFDLVLFSVLSCAVVQCSILCCCSVFYLVLLFSVLSSSMTRLIPSGQLLSMIWLVVIELVLWFAFIGIMVVSTE